MHSDFTLHHQHHQRAIHLPLPGKHNVYNALAAASACLAIDIPLTTIQHALQHMPTVKQRLQHHISAQGAYILDDTYNANPASVSAGLDVLASSQGETVWVFGDMGELGEDAAHLHAQLGTLATQKHITTLLTLGELSRHTHQHFVGNKQHFTDKSALLRVLQNYLNPGTTIYIKGSRFMHMEDIVHALLPTTLT